MEVLNNATDLAKSKGSELISNATSKIDSIPLVSDAKDAFNNVKDLGGKVAETADKLKNALKKPDIPKIPNLKTLRLRKPEKPKMKEIPVPQKFKKAADIKAQMEAAKAAKEKAMAKIEAAKSMASDFKSKAESISSNIPKF